MSTFYTAVQKAKKEGYTHVVSGNGEKAALSLVTKNMKPSPSLKKTGWEFATLHGTGQCLVYFSHPGHVIGYYQLTKE